MKLKGDIAGEIFAFVKIGDSVVTGTRRIRSANAIETDEVVEDDPRRGAENTGKAMLPAVSLE